MNEDIDPTTSDLNELLERAAFSSPDAVALVFGEQSITHQQLHRRANRLAHRLRAVGVGRDSLVGIHLERHPGMVVAILAVLKAGGAYVPLDPAFPADRLAFMVEDSAMPVIITQASLRGTLSAPAARLIDEADAADESDAPLVGISAPEDLAYILFTSGSTGRPKGVQIPRSAVVNFLGSMRRDPGLTAADRVIAITTISFDIAVLELLLPLAVGARIVLEPRETSLDGAALMERLRSQGVTLMQATPSTWRILLAAGWQGAPGFRSLVGGEALPRDLAEDLIRTSPGGAWNMYGPTETTVWSTIWRLASPVKRVLIGTPIARTTIDILGADLQPVPAGAEGELCIGGDGVARGYLHRPELTAERFVPDRRRPGGRIYRTGDLGRSLPDGSFEYLGRNDQQVKIRGYRIELGEIENVLVEHPAVAVAVVLAREDRADDVRLVAYLQPRTPGTHPHDAVNAHIVSRLPAYMVPQHLMWIESFPLTPNGKIDRRALPSPLQRSAAAASAPPPPASGKRRDRILAAVSETMNALAGLPLDVHVAFAAQGFHSMLLTQAVVRLNRALGSDITYRQLADSHPTISALVDHLDATLPPDASSGDTARPAQSAARFDPQRPPVANARLGRDRAGNPGWFIPDPAAPGTWRQLDVRA